MADRNSYQIRRATSTDDERVLQLMKSSFFRDEPLNIAVGLLDDVDTCPELEQFCLETLCDGLSLIAESPDGNMVGACLNGCHVPGHVDQMEAEAENCPNPKFRKILRLLAYLERRADVFGKFPEVNELLEIRIVAVDALWRGKGVATALLKQTKQLASELGFTLIKVDCTSYFSALAMMKLNAQCVFSMKYADYSSPGSDEPVFKPEPPHTGVKTFVQIVPRVPTAVRENGTHKSTRVDDLDR